MSGSEYHKIQPSRKLQAEEARRLRRRGAKVRVGWCGSVGCAMGLARLMGIVHNQQDVGEIADALGMDPDGAHAVFHDGDTYGASDMRAVTPTEVADELERRLAGAD